MKYHTIRNALISVVVGKEEEEDEEEEATL